MVESISGQIIQELSTINPDTDYYAITLLGTVSGGIEWSAYTHFVGWVGNKPGREIRQASLVNAIYMAKSWDDLGESYVAVNTIRTLLIYLRLGGNALVKKEIADKYFSDFVAAHETAYDGPAGFKSVHGMPPHAFRRATRPKHRMRILKRDQYRCRICGRKPDDYTDIELHVHHIRPWERGGITEDDNLMGVFN